MPPPASRSASSAPSLALAAAAGLPLCAYLATTSGHGYWLDSGEFVAAAAELGISHPPGHPLAALVSAALTMLPLGSLAFRVALASALMAGAAAALFHRAVDRTLLVLGLPWRSVRIPLALATTWAVSAASGFWLQGVRPEVYAL